MGSNTKHSWIAKLIIAILIVSCATCLKHGSKSQPHTTTQSNDVSPTTTPTASDKTSKPSTSIEKMTDSGKKETKAEKKNEKTTQTKKGKEDEKAKGDEENQKQQFLIQATQNQYVIPIQVGESSYNLGLCYGEQKAPFGKMPSWIFTSLTDTHQLCDASDDCQEIIKFLKCQSGKNKVSDCVDDGKAKHNDELQSKKKAKITYKNNENTRQCSFVSPSKATLSLSTIGENEISGMLNLATVGDKEFNSLILKDKNLTIIKQELFKSQFEGKGIVDLNKTGILSLTDSKDLYLRTKNKDDKVSNNIKSSYEKIRLGFNKVDVVMAVTKDMMVAIKNILKKEYFGDRCKIKDYQVTCSASPIQNITKLSFCRDKDGRNCLNLDILGMVIKEIKADKTYQILIQQHKQDGDQTSLVFYPKLAEHFKIYASYGLVRGVEPLKQSTGQKSNPSKAENQKDKNQRQQEQNSEKSEQKESKQEEDEKKEKLKQKSNVKSKPDEKTQQQSEEKETKKKKKQQQASEEKDEKDEKNEIEQKSKKQEKQDKEKKQDKEEKQDKVSEEDEGQTKNKKDHNKAKQNQQQQKEEDEEKGSQQKKEKTKGKKNKSSPKHIESSLAEKGSIEEEQKYSKGILFFTFLYGSIFVGLILIIKWKAKESVAAAAIDRFLEVTWYAIVQNYFTRSQGYNPPTFEEEEPKGNEQVDRSDSVAVGYSYKQGKELFWENNSIEGF